jgi:hypothetical protein
MNSAGARSGFARWASLTNSINGMKIAGTALAIAMSAAVMCAATQASAQVSVFMGPGGSSANNSRGQGSAGLGTSGLGLGGFGSATENLREPDPNAGSGQGLGLFNQGTGNALGVTGGAGGGAGSTSQGSLSSAIDRPSSPMNSVTNSLMGSIGTGGTTIPALKPVAKRKPSHTAKAASENGGAAAKETTAKTP